MPRSFLLPAELRELEMYMKHYPEETLICKPSKGRGGEGISLIKKFADLPKSA
jgi:hypothetical protein